MVKINEFEETSGPNIIARGTIFEGNILNASDCRIDGTLRGNINSLSKVIIGKTGKVEGEIKCTSIEIEGEVCANIHAQELVSLKATANLKGNIQVGKIAIEPGAIFTGNCTMQTPPRPVTPTIVEKK